MDLVDITDSGKGRKKGRYKGGIMKLFNKRKKDSRPRVVIIGGGFAGLTTALNLDRSFDVTLLDPKPWFEFLPNIHELVSGHKRPATGFTTGQPKTRGLRAIT